MGGDFLGPFAMGLVGTMNRMQAVNSENQYKKALIEQSKLHTKLLENQIAQADAKQGMMDMFLRANGIEPPPRQVQQPMQLPQGQQPQAGIIPALGRMFGFGNAAQAQQPTPPQPLPQTIAQGQMQAQMPGQVPVNRPLLNDIMRKQLFDIPGWEERFAAESKQVGRTINTLDSQGRPITIVVDKMNKPMGAYPTPAEPYRQKIQTPQGTFEIEQPKYGTGGAGGYGPMTQVAPPEMERTKIKTNFGDFEVLQPKYGQAGTTTQVAPAGEGMTADRAGKINLIGNAMDRVPEIQGLIYPNGKLDRGILAKGKNPLGIPIGNGAMLYSKMYQAMDAALRMETGAQANPSEIDTKVKEFWPNAYDTEEAIKSKLGDFEKYISGAANVIDPTGEMRKIRTTGNVPTGTAQGKPSLNLGGGLTANKIEQEYQQALKQRPDLAPQLKAKRDQLMQQVR